MGKQGAKATLDHKSQINNATSYRQLQNKIAESAEIQQESFNKIHKRWSIRWRIDRLLSQI